MGKKAWAYRTKRLDSDKFLQLLLTFEEHDIEEDSWRNDEGPVWAFISQRLLSNNCSNRKFLYTFWLHDRRQIKTSFKEIKNVGADPKKKGKNIPDHLDRGQEPCGNVDEGKNTSGLSQSNIPDDNGGIIPPDHIADIEPIFSGQKDERHTISTNEDDCENIFSKSQKVNNGCQFFYDLPSSDDESFGDISSFDNIDEESEWLDSDHEGGESSFLKNQDCQEGSIDADSRSDIIHGNKADTVREMSDEHVSDDNKKKDLIFPREFSMQISSEEWNQIYEKNDPKLSPGYGNIIRQHVKRYNPASSLAFHYKRVCKPNSRKKQLYWWHGKAKCKRSGCNASFSFKIDHQPTESNPIDVNCEMKGTVTHKDEEIETVRSAPLTGAHRQKMKKRVELQGPSNVYFENVANMGKDSLKYGNKDDMPNLATIQRLITEARQKSDYARDPVADLILTQEILKENDIESEVIKGYIQELTIHPLRISLYHESQIKIYIERVKEGQAWLYFDATGTVVSKTSTNQKRLLYYSAVLKNSAHQPPIPVAEMVSETHNTATIASFLLHFKASVAQFIQKPSPQKVELDFSWASIQGCLLAFNSCDAKQYLKSCYSLLLKRDVQKVPFTVIHLCVAHFMKNTSTNIHEVCKDKGLVRFALHAFGKLQTAVTLDEGKCLFRSIAVVLLSPTKSNEVQHNIKTLQTLFYEESIPGVEGGSHQILCESHSEEDHLHQPSDSIKASSPFTSIFQEIEDEVQKSKDSDENVNEEKNAYYSPQIFAKIASYMYLFPLWSGIVIYLLPQKIKKDSNSIVEGWMKIVKQDILQKQRRLKIGRFVRKLHTSLKGRVRAFQITTHTKKRKRYPEQEDDLAEEKWSKRIRKGTPAHTYFTPPRRIPTPRKKVPMTKTPRKTSRRSIAGKPRGIKNLGTTCWMNSSLQALRCYLSNGMYSFSVIDDNRESH